jgi:hypothetical protein
MLGINGNWGRTYKGRRVLLNIERVLNSLSKKRPIFHSEADLQQSITWEIREHYPDCKVWLETKCGGGNSTQK